MTAFFLFSVSMSITPGAGNLTLLGISNRFGFTAALPFVGGTALGVLVVFVGTSAGLLGVLTAMPEVYMAMKYLGAGYLLYLAWGIANTPLQQEPGTSQGAGMLSGAMIQILNPKAWIAAMTVFSQFMDTSNHQWTQASFIIFGFVMIMTLCTLGWAYFGAVLKRLLNSPRQMQVINRSLALTLALTVIYMLGQTN